MKRIYFISLFLIGFAVVASAQSKGQIIDDVYLTPNDQSMMKKTTPVRKTTEPAVYKNGAREIVFIDQNGNRTNIVSDTVFVVNTDTLAVDYEDGYYLNGFKGSKSDLEYAERIRRFHNPRYTIHISDPRYNDIYFLDSYDWNVYLDGSYAYVTPTWTNPYWWNYNYSPNSSWGWGLGWNSYWGRPYYGSYWGSYYGWGYGGYYDPWYSSYYPWYNGYWGYGGYPYYSGYYGYGYGYGYPYYGGGYYNGYPYYGGGYYYSNNTVDVSNRRRGTVDNGRYVPEQTITNVNRRAASIGGRSSANPYTVVSRTREEQYNYRNSVPGERSSSNVDASRSVRSSNEWNATRSSGAYSTRTERSSSVMTNRSNPTETRRYDSYGTSSSRSYDNSGSRSSGNNYNYPSRSSSYDSGSRSSGSYSAPSRSSSSYDSGSRSSSSSSSSSSGSSGSRSSSSSTSSNRR